MIAASIASIAGCGPVHEWPYAENPHCTSEFCVDLPGNGGASVWLSGNDACSLMDLIDSKSQWFSVEWCQSRKLRAAGAGAFYDYWNGAELTYLHGDFGKAKYALVASRRVTLKNGSPALAFAGSGTHNGGKRGAVLVLATTISGNAVQVYLLLDRQLPVNFDILTDRNFQELQSIAETVRQK